MVLARNRIVRTPQLSAAAIVAKSYGAKVENWYPSNKIRQKKSA